MDSMSSAVGALGNSQCINEHYNTDVYTVVSVSVAATQSQAINILCITQSAQTACKLSLVNNTVFGCSSINSTFKMIITL